MSSVPTVGLFTAFVAGLLSFLSPCVAPLLPGYFTMISGSATTSTVSTQRMDRMRTFWPSLLFVAGFALVFISLGAAASAFGNVLDEFRRPLGRIAGLVMIVMGAVVLWGARMPLLMRERRFHVTPRSFTPSEILLLGMAFGFGWTPCFGPILASILVYTSTSDTVREGTLLLTAYSFGLGVPFLAAGLSLGRTQRVVRWISHHAGAVVVFSGMTMIIIGTLFLTGQMFRFAILGQKLMGRLPGPFGG